MLLCKICRKLRITLNCLVLTKMPISNKTDPLYDEVPMPGKESYADNPGIQPHGSAIAQTPGEKSSGGTEPMEINKPQPFKKTGMGYC